MDCTAHRLLFIIINYRLHIDNQRRFFTSIVSLFCILQNIPFNKNSIFHEDLITTFFYLSIYPQHFIGPYSLLHSRKVFFTMHTSRTPWTNDQLAANRYVHTGKHTHRIKARRHSYLERDSSPRSKCLSGR